MSIICNFLILFFSFGGKGKGTLFAETSNALITI